VKTKTSKLVFHFLSVVDETVRCAAVCAEVFIYRISCSDRFSEPHTTENPKKKLLFGYHTMAAVEQQSKVRLNVLSPSSKYVLFIMCVLVLCAVCLDRRGSRRIDQGYHEIGC
jgi:hypothetical protein